MVVTKDDVDEIVKMLLINNQKTVQGYAIASLYFKIGEHHTALKYVSKYLKLKPNSFVAWKLQGECYEKLNRTDDALNAYDKAINSFEKKRSVPVVSSSLKEIKLKALMERCGTLESSVAGKNPATRNQEMHSPCTASTISDVTDLHTESYDETTCSEMTFNFTLDHISTLDCIASSQQFAFQNLTWRIFVGPKRDLGANRTLSFYLVCNEDSVSSLWSCNVEVEFRLLSVVPNHDPFVRKLRHLFIKEDNVWGYSRFMSWYDVVSPDNNYIENNCITVEVHVEVLDKILE